MSNVAHLYSPTLKNVIVCGAKACGKTTILENVIHDRILDQGDYQPTLEDYYEAIIDGCDASPPVVTGHHHSRSTQSTGSVVKQRFRFVDTEGLTESHFSPNGPTSPYRHWLPILADAFVLVYNEFQEHSFHMVDAVRREIEESLNPKDVKKELYLVVLANKVQTSDLKDQPSHPSACVDINQAVNWASFSRSSKVHVKLFQIDSYQRSTLIEPFLFIGSIFAPHSPVTGSSSSSSGVNSSSTSTLLGGIGSSTSSSGGSSGGSTRNFLTQSLSQLGRKHSSAKFKAPSSVVIPLNNSGAGGNNNERI